MTYAYSEANTDETEKTIKLSYCVNPFPKFDTAILPLLGQSREILVEDIRRIEEFAKQYNPKSFREDLEALLVTAGGRPSDAMAPKSKLEREIEHVVKGVTG